MKPLPRPSHEGIRRRGTVVELNIDSVLLRGNLLGDPHRRMLPVYLPPGYAENSGRRYPVAHYLAGFLGIGRSKLNWKAWVENLPERLDRLIGDGTMGPMIVAFPDCMTLLGGSQYIDSSVCGPYGRHLVEELVPAVDRAFRTLPDRDHRAVLGKSSGGFGAMVHAMLHPETWGAAAVHSGDSYFEFCFLTDLPRTINEINKAGSLRAFLDRVMNKPKHNSAETHALMHLAMAACFDPDPSLPEGFVLPVDLHTGRLDETRWQRWLDWDPVRMIPDHVDALRSMRLLFIDCGFRDQYQLHFGARQMRDVLLAHDVIHEYQEFPDNHSSIDYRLDQSLPAIQRAIAAR
jgi:hypothetical protein